MAYTFKSLLKLSYSSLTATSLTTMSLLAGVGALIELSLPKAAIATEEIRLKIGGPIVFSVSVDSLETFAETGEIEDDLRLVTRFVGEDNLSQVRQALQRPLPLDVVQTANLAYSELGNDLLQNIGKIFKAHPNINGARGLRGALVKAAAQAGPEGWTAIDVLRQFPTSSIDIALGDLITFRQSLAVFFSYNEAVISAIKAESAAEAAQQSAISNPQNLSQPGPYQYNKSAFTISQTAVRETKKGLQVNYDFNVETFLPIGLTEPAPIILISHGFGAVQESFDFLGAHLASYGYVVMIPDHVGSDLSVRQNFLQGFVNTILSPLEFISRPQEVSLLIDELERLAETSPDWAATLDLDRIGMVGDSLGGSTVLALAGAEINYNRIDELCNEEQVILNASMYLQCQARYLPPQNVRLEDPRIKAVIASHTIGSGLYGQRVWPKSKFR